MGLPAAGVYRMVEAWCAEGAVPLAPAPRRWLAGLVCAVVEAGACTQPALACALQRLRLTTATNESIQVGIRRFLSDARLDVAAVYAPLVRPLVASWPAAVAVVIVDATPLKNRLVRLEASLAYHGRALPLSWAVYPASGIPAETSWLALLLGVLDEAAPLLPPGVPVLVLLDRGFTSPAVWDAVVARGWHPVLRAQRSVRLRAPDGGEQALGDLLTAEPGLVALAGEVFKKGGWRAATVTALRRDGMAEAWLLLSDLPAGEQRALEYAVRMHIEESFRDDKRQGWQWEQSRIRAPDRARRLLLVLHLATLWCLSAGVHAMQTGRARQWVRPSRPAWSLFRLGWHWLRHAIATDEPPPSPAGFPLLSVWPTPLLTAPPQP